MDFLDPKLRKSHNQRLAIGYVLIAILIALATYILFLVGGVGYGVNRKTGDVIQNGLVLVAVKPSNAMISLNGAEQARGEARLNIPAGSHKISISLDGYQAWEKEINVSPGGLERVIYPTLFPAEPKTALSSRFEAQPIMTTQSPDQKWLMSQLVDGTLTLVDLSKPTISSIITVPAGVVTSSADKAVSVFDYQEWSADNRHVLLGHKLDSGTREYIVVDRESPEKSTNITQRFLGQNITQATFRDKKHDKFYLYDSVSAILFRTDSQAVMPVASNVAQFKSYRDDTLLYVSKPDPNSEKTDLYFVTGDKKAVLRKLPVSTNYLLDIAEFDGRLFVVAGSSLDGRAYIYKDIMAFYDDDFKSSSPYRVLVVDSPISVSFSTNARFIALQSEVKTAIYDTETESQITYDKSSDWSGPVPGRWMDGHRFVRVDGSGVARVMDFDATNSKELARLATNSGMYFTADYDTVFGFVSGADGVFNLAEIDLTN